MSTPIYFSKVKYEGGLVGGNWKFKMVLDLKQKELTYQVTEHNYESSSNGMRNLAQYSKKLPIGQMNLLLPLCNAIDFKPYMMDLSEPLKEWPNMDNVIAYRDGLRITCCGITESYMPPMDFDMYFIYDAEHERPQEKLYRYLIKNYIRREKTLKNYILG